MKTENYAETAETKIYKQGELIESQTYYYVNDLIYERHNMSLVEINETTETRKVNFMFITDIELNEKNEKEIVKLGRKRWKIENKGFNDEKNHGYGLTHAYSYHENVVKCHSIILLISYLFMQLLEHYLKTKKLKEKIKTIGKEIKMALRFAHLNALDYIAILAPSQIRQEIPY